MNCRSIFTLLSILITLIPGCNTSSQNEGEIKKYSEILKKNPHDAESYFERGKAYIEVEKYDKAISDFNRILEDKANKPIFHKVYERRGYAYQMKGDYERAISDYNKSIKLNPGHFPAIVNKAKAVKAKANRDENR